jgi:hypothetical protein
MSDPILKAAADLQKELADVQSPEAQQHMDEIMKLILGCVVESSGQRKS